MYHVEAAPGVGRLRDGVPRVVVKLTGPSRERIRAGSREHFEACRVGGLEANHPERMVTGVGDAELGGRLGGPARPAEHGQLGWELVKFRLAGPFRLAAPASRASDKVARASRLRVSEGVPPRGPCCLGGGTPQELAGETPALPFCHWPCPCLREDSRQACITCWVFKAISGHRGLSVPDLTCSAKWRKSRLS